MMVVMMVIMILILMLIVMIVMITSCDIFNAGIIRMKERDVLFRPRVWIIARWIDVARGIDTLISIALSPDHR